MKPARIILLLVALGAGLLAAFLVMRGSSAPQPETIVTEVTREEQRTQILVARHAIGMGERLSGQNVEWTDWPAGAVRSEYVTRTAMPDAPAELTGAVARFEFFGGEPIREQKLVRADQGYLSAVLSEGMRGVSVPVAAESSAGGYIVPNDHVDVVLTRSSQAGQVSELVLSNVRVLAIGNRLGEVGASAGQTQAEIESGEGPQAQIFDRATIATLELTPRQAETIINAQSRGGLSLVLRSVVDFQEDPVIAQNQSLAQAVRLIRYGRESSVMSGQVSAEQSAAFGGAASAAPIADPGPSTLPEIQVQ